MSFWKFSPWSWSLCNTLPGLMSLLLVNIITVRPVKIIISWLKLFLYKLGFMDLELAASCWIRYLKNLQIEQQRSLRPHFHSYNYPYLPSGKLVAKLYSYWLLSNFFKSSQCKAGYIYVALMVLFFVLFNPPGCPWNFVYMVFCWMSQICVSWFEQFTREMETVTRSVSKLNKSIECKKAFQWCEKKNYDM